MATNKKITELTELTEADLSDNDVLAIVDISEDTTHKVRKSTLAAALSGVSQVEATTPIAVNQTTGEVTVSISSTPTFGTVDLTADTSTGDNAAIGYTAAEGLILTGQGSTNDVTIKNDADADVLEIPTGTTNVTVVGSVTAASLAGSGSGLTAGTTPITTLDIDGGTDIGEGIVDADLFIVDNGAGGTNRKTAASRLKTYIGGFTDPMTTRGDVIKRGASAAERLAIGSANTVLTTDGTDPAWSTVTNAMLAGSIDLTSKVTGVLPVANGGSGASSLTDGGILLGSGTGAVTAMAALAKGTLVVGDGSTDPTTQAVGTNDHVLTADSAQGSGVKWAAVDSGLAAASQAEMEAGSSNTVAVTPGRLQHGKGSAKVWCTWEANGSINVSYNVSSITDTGTGDWDINYTTNFSSTNYVAVSTAHITGTALIASNGARAVDDIQINIRNTSGSLTDANCYTVIFGDQ
jgi:hypothetical protein|tara:strand:+ start:5001 stop:6392 length:1392 start_codon:yes stop_codon:yes gene_type:complete